MRAAVVLTFLVMALTGGCLGNGAPDPGAAVVTVTQEVPPNAAGPTQTWQQWLGEQVAKGECGNSSNTLMYQNVSKEPPYSADFFCRAPTQVPNVVATQVAATVAAIPTPTRKPRATPRPTLAPVSTPTPAWQQTATPYPTPTFNEWLGWKTSTLKCEDPRDELALETAQWTWPYEASFSCMSPTPLPKTTRKPTERPQPTATPRPRPTTAWHPTTTPSPSALQVLHGYENGELFVAAYVTWNDNSYIGAGVQLFQMMPGSGSVCVSTYYTESKSFRNWPPECHFAGSHKPNTVEVDFQGRTYLAVPVLYKGNPFRDNARKTTEELPLREILKCAAGGTLAAYTGDATMLTLCIELLQNRLEP